MAGPDNQRFETMLRHELKAGVSPSGAQCPGPEQLAALWERSLSRSEHALVESHIAGCARCQAAMAAMARAESGAADEAAPAHAPGLWLRVTAPAAVLAVVVIIISLHLFGAPMRSRREQIALALRHRIHRHHWKPAPVLTPAPPPSEKRGGLAAGAKAPPPPQPAVVARAENTRKENPAPPPAAKELAPPARELAMRERPTAAELAAGQERALAPSVITSAPSPVTHRAEVRPPSAGAAAPQSVPQPAPAPPPAAPAGVESNYGTGAIEEAQPQPATHGAPIGTEPGSRSSALEQFANAPAGQAIPGTAAAVAAPAVSAVSPQGLRRGFASFQSPPPVVAWNVGADGLIQRLGPGGWESLPSGTSVDLLAGSAPSAQVCWVVGKNGTVLRTIDGGNRWQPITPPAPVDLVKIETSGPDSATVTTADGRQFSTTDGGRNWTKL